ncbi:alkaline phosphatase family protein [candidate division KSB1 bacterium]|nr:alkaline phosphatase family protein [candidate division KSB1 bacterium]
MAQSQIQNVIIIDIDGLRRDLLYNTLAEDSLREPSKKNLPNLSKIAGNIYLEDIKHSNEINLYGDYDVKSSDSLVANRCVTVFPSYTYPAQATIFTGLFPKNHGITANFHFDRTGTSLAAKGKSENFSMFESLSFFTNEGSGNRMMNKGTKTIYDYLNEQYKCAVSSNLFVSQNQNAVNHVIGMFPWRLPWRFEGKDKSKIDWLIPNIFKQTQFITESAADGIGDYRDNFDEEMMDDVMTYLNDFLEHKHPPPNLFTLYFGGHDHQAHISVKDDRVAHPDIRAQRDYLKNTVDTQLGRFLILWEKLIDQNPTLKNTLFVICSDHGHTGADWDDNKRITRKEVKKVLKYCGYDVLGKSEFGELESSCNCITTITAASAQIHVRRAIFEYRSRGIKVDWTTSPALKDLEEIMQEFSKANQGKSKENNFLTGAFDYILFKDYERKTYQVYEFDTNRGSGNIKSINKNFGKENGYILAKERLEEFYCENSGDILLLINYRDHYRFEKRYRMKSTHGSFLASDSYVPLIFSTPYDPGLIRKRTSGDYSKGIIPTAKIADITPTILHQFNVRGIKFDGVELF